jgi:NAD(P)H-hydrate repair Nnr-like enzyme with NAD(P)H-hydrate dehydratase domain
MAAANAAYIHGKAGQMAAAGLSVYSVTAGDVAEYIAKALAV